MEAREFPLNPHAKPVPFEPFSKSVTFENDSFLYTIWMGLLRNTKALRDPAIESIADDIRCLVVKQSCETIDLLALLCHTRSGVQVCLAENLTSAVEIHG